MHGHRDKHATEEDEKEAEGEQGGVRKESQDFHHWSMSDVWCRKGAYIQSTTAL